MSAYYNENDQQAAAWLRELIKAGLIAPGDVDERSIKDVSPDDVAGYGQCHFFAGIGGWSCALRLAGIPDDFPVWTGSCPCQPFSSAGKRKGKDDDRHLWPELFRLIKTRRPACVLGEQVFCEEWLEIIAVDLEREGYTVWPEVHRASCAGADHERRRLYWHASNATCQRQQKQRQCREDACNHAADEFREADRLVDAFRRQTLPFLCRGHDGLSGRVGQVCIKGFGNAIVPQCAAEFIKACLTET